MIVKNDNRIQINSLFPNSDWYNEGNYVIDETKEENRELIEKIKANAPYMDLVIEDGQIVDIIPTERPEPEPIVTEPTDIELLQQENQSLQQQLTLINADFQSFMDFYFSTL